MARPGIMLYFDILEPVKVLPDADKGRLLVAMLEYGQFGTVPDFDGMLALAWGFVKPKLDKDSEEYNRTILKRQYAVYCRSQKQKGEPEISFDEWVKTTSHHMISHDITWYPTTTTTTSTSTKTSTTTTTAAAATTKTTTNEENGGGSPDSSVSVVGGDLGKGVVFLSEDQISDLLDRMGLETFDYYVDKLSSFIIKNDAKVRNHYETILKWWHTDSLTKGG